MVISALTMSVCVVASVAKAWLFDEFFFDSSLLRRILKTLQRVFISSRTNPFSESLLSPLLSLLFFVSLSLGHSSFLQSYSRSKSLSAFENRNSLGDAGVPALKRKIGGGY